MRLVLRLILSLTLSAAMVLPTATVADHPTGPGHEACCCTAAEPVALPAGSCGNCCSGNAAVPPLQSRHALAQADSAERKARQTVVLPDSDLVDHYVHRQLCSFLDCSLHARTSARPMSLLALGCMLTT